MEEAEHHVRKSYSFVALVNSKLIPGTVPDPQALYCSTFVALAIYRGSGKSLYMDQKFRPIYPSVLASHPALLDVALEWRHV